MEKEKHHFKLELEIRSDLPKEVFEKTVNSLFDMWEVLSPNKIQLVDTYSYDLDRHIDNQE